MEIYELKSKVEYEKQILVKQSMKYERIIKQKQHAISDISRSLRDVEVEMNNSRKIIGQKDQIIR